MTTNDDDVGCSGSWDVIALEELEPVGDSPENRRRVDGSNMFIPFIFAVCCLATEIACGVNGWVWQWIAAQTCNPETKQCLFAGGLQITCTCACVHVCVCVCVCDYSKHLE